MEKLLLATALCCASITVAHAQSADDSGYHAHYPQSQYFSYMTPPSPGAYGAFGFLSGENRGYPDEDYNRAHGLKSSSADCDFASCPCPSPYYRNLTNCAPVWPTRPPEQSEED